MACGRDKKIGATRDRKCEANAGYSAAQLGRAAHDGPGKAAALEKEKGKKEILPLAIAIQIYIHI